MLDGFTVTNGSNTAGGGILCQRSASPTIRHNFIIGNSAAEGGGIFFAGSDAQVIGNVFLDNSASVGGGAICCYYMTDHAARIENNFIIDNWINSSFGLGGGIYCRYGAPPMTNNFVARNSATCGGGIYCDADRDILIVNNTVTENTATHEGGGIFCYASGFNNCTITKNVAADAGAFDNGYLQTIDHPEWGETIVIGSPIAMSETASTPGRIAPDLGEHTHEVLTELGYDDARIAALGEDGVI